MFLPSPIDNVECQPVTCEIVSSIGELLHRLVHCRTVKFSGYLSLKITEAAEQVCNLYFLNGWLIGGTGGAHPMRRWSRQVVRYCPQLGPELPTQSVDPSQLWDYSSLMQRVDQSQLSQSQVAAVVRGSLTEMLFDFIQAHQLCNISTGAIPRHRISNIHLSYHDFCQKISTLPPIVVQPSHAMQSAMQAWSAWSQLSLDRYSPNLAPVIQDYAALRQQMPAAVYRSLTECINGSLTLRDLALKLNQYPILLTRSLVPLVNQGLIGLRTVPDIVYSPRADGNIEQAVGRQTGKSQAGTSSGRGLIAYIEDSQFDCATMGQILEQTDHRFISIRDSVQALLTLLEHKPDLIFLDVLMPMVNGYEVCAQIRQISSFKNTPVIIVTSSDGIVDRVRANLVGASGFLAKPITPEKVLSTLKTHLPVSSSFDFFSSPKTQLKSQPVTPERRAWR
ncbi:MAG: response regulator [Elainellaceae cyanobacterium]